MVVPLSISTVARHPTHKINDQGFTKPGKSMTPKLQFDVVETRALPLRELFGLWIATVFQNKRFVGRFSLLLVFSTFQACSLQFYCHTISSTMQQKHQQAQQSFWDEITVDIEAQKLRCNTKQQPTETDRRL